MRQSRERLLGYRPRRRGRRAQDPVALIPAAGDGPERAGRAARGDRPQPRGAAGAEAGRAAGPEPARRGLLLRRDRRDDRLQPDQNQPLPGRGPRALPQPASPAARTAAAARELRPLLSAFCDGEASAARGERRCASTCAPAPPAARRCAPTGRRRGSRSRAGAGAAALPLAAGAGAGARSPACGSRLPGIGGGGDSASPRSPPPAARGAPAWPPSRRCWRSAPARRAARPPAWRPGVLPAPLTWRPTHAPKPAIERPSPRAGRGASSEAGRLRTAPAGRRRSPKPTAEASSRQPEAGSRERRSGRAPSGRGRIRTAARRAGARTTGAERQRQARPAARRPGSSGHEQRRCNALRSVRR